MTTLAVSLRGRARIAGRCTDHLLAPFVFEIDVDIGGSRRSAEMNRSNRRSCFVGSTSVMPRPKQIGGLAAEPASLRENPRDFAKRTMSWTVRK